MKSASKKLKNWSSDSDGTPSAIIKKQIQLFSHPLLKIYDLIENASNILEYFRHMSYIEQI